MYLTALSFAIILIGAILALMGAQKGSRVGLIQSAMNLCSIIVSAILATFFSDWMSGMLESPAYSIIYGTGLLDGFASEMGNMYSVIEMIAQPIAAMLLYIPMFFAFYGICRLVCHLVYKEYCAKLPDNRVEYASQDAPFYVRESASLGMACGIVSGILLTIIVMSPIAGGLKTANKVVKLVSADDGAAFSDSEYYHLQRYSDDVMVSVVYCAGGKPLFDMTTMIKGGNGRVFIEDEIEYLASVSIDEVESAIVGSIKGDAAATKQMSVYTKNSAIIDELSYLTYKNACDSWRGGQSYLGIESPISSCNSVFKYLIQQLLDDCCYSGRKDFFTNYNTMTSVVKIIHEVQELAGNGNDYQTVLKILITGNVAERVKAEIDKNKKINVDSSYLDTAVMSIISVYVINKIDYSMYSRYNLFEDIAEAYTSIDASSVEARAQELEDGLVEIFGRYEIVLPKNAIAKLAVAMADELDGHSFIYSGYVENFLMRYYNSYDYYRFGDVNYGNYYYN